MSKFIGSDGEDEGGRFQLWRRTERAFHFSRPQHDGGWDCFGGAASPDYEGEWQAAKRVAEGDEEVSAGSAKCSRFVQA